MPDINENIRRRLEEYPEPVGRICRELVTFAQTMPEPAVKQHLDNLVRRAVKKEELTQ
jgi:hypothetical protein